MGKIKQEKINNKEKKIIIIIIIIIIINQIKGKEENDIDEEVFGENREREKKIPLFASL